MADPARPRRPLLAVLLLLLLAAAGLWGSSRLTWEVTVAPRPGGGSVVQALDGATRQPALVALAVLGVAAVAAVVATAGWVRRALGVLLVLAGVAALALAVRLGAAPAAPASLADQVHRAQGIVPFAHGLAGVAGLLLVFAGALTVRYERVMPRMGARYRARSAERPAGEGETRLWSALDHGEDPTIDGE